MNEFTDKERRCQASFQNGGPYWHAYTSGKETPILFTCNEDKQLTMNVIAQIAFVFAKRVRIITFQVMDNHFHFVICGTDEAIREFFACITKRLSRVMGPEKGGIIRNIKLSIKHIDNLQTLRNTIIYVNRNGYVADPAHTPFSYPWGASRYYFQMFPHGKSMGDINVTEARQIFRGRDPKLPANWGLVDGCVSPASYCEIDFGMSMFRDAHHYFYSICKNIESYSGIASDIDDGEFLTDQELFTEIVKILDSKYSGARLRDISPAQKLDIARTLHYQYHSSNGQICRLLGLSQYDINHLFPENS